MYTDFYQLWEEPFRITPDPRFLYLTPQHREALNHMLYGLSERKGFICITGEVGAGKTTLCRALLNGLPETWHSALILNPVLTETQLLRAIVDEFGIETRRRDRLGLLTLINDFLLRINCRARDAVVIIDEAQDMPHKTLEMTRLLTNLETEKQKLLQIVLVGQPELRDRLRRPRLRQLAQRITVRYHLQNMSRQDTEGYLRHRLRVAGVKEEGGRPVLRFDRGAIREIHRYSRGTPRLVNAVGDKALLAGYVYRTSRINRRIVRRAIRELKEAG
jgi:general secretion pathway protein A